MPPLDEPADAARPAAAFASRLEAVFTQIAATRMADFPLSQPALRVEAVGFRPWEGLIVGVLVLPWAMNLVIAADGHPEFSALPTGRARVWTFPSGEYECYGLAEPGLPPLHLCSLFSPMREFASPEQARAVASAIMDALLTVPAQAPVAGAPESTARRQFLRGRLPGPTAKAYRAGEETPHA